MMRVGVYLSVAEAVLHCLVLDGVYHTTEGTTVFHPVRAPSVEQLHILLHQIIKRVMKLLTRRGYLIEEQGFSLHAEVRCAMNQRKKLEQLCRYITRPAIANERLKLNSAGDVVLRLKSPYQDGTTHIVMSPLEFMQRLVPLRLVFSVVQ